MMLKLSEYHRPRTVAEALDFLRRPGVPTLPLAGGTELLGRKDFTTQALVDLSTLGLDGLDTDEAGGLHIGAMVRLQTLVEDSRVRNFAGGVLSEAAAAGVPRTIRNGATLGGSLAGERGGPELQAVLVALGARVHLVGSGSLELEVDDFFQRKPRLLPGSLITEVTIPPLPEGARVAYQRVARTPADRAALCVAVAARWEGDRCRWIRVGVAGLTPKVLRLSAVERGMRDRPWDDEAREAAAAAISEAGAEAVTDVLADGRYRVWVAPVLLRRAVEATR